MQECFLQTLHMGTARMEKHKKTEVEDKQKKVKM